MEMTTATGVNRQQKAERVTALAERLRDVPAVYLADFTGLNVQRMTELRRRLREAQAELMVVKNTLARRAFQGLDFPELGDLLTGPTALILSVRDPVAPARVIREFAEANEKRPAVRAGVVEGRLLTGEEVKVLALLPPKEQIFGAIAGSLTAGVGGIAGALGALVRDLALLIEEVARRRGGQPAGASGH